jgi:alkylated DNA repair dioxygenase AlkB
MHGVVARRTVIHFGFDYDYEGWSIRETDPPPPLLAALRDRAAEVAGVDAASLEQFLVARYPPGATIGWHRDAPMFGSPVIGVSLGAACRMRFRRKVGDGFETDVQVLEPRSLYILSGAARSVWQHHIPATKGLRYSITMRTVVRRPDPSHRHDLAVIDVAPTTDSRQPTPSTPGVLTLPTRRDLRDCSCLRHPTPDNRPPRRQAS